MALPGVEIGCDRTSDAPVPPRPDRDRGRTEAELVASTRGQASCATARGPASGRLVRRDVEGSARDRPGPLAGHVREGSRAEHLEDVLVPRAIRIATILRVLGDPGVDRDDK